MTRLLDGAALARTIRAEVKADVDELVSAGGRPPRLVAVLVGEDPASQIYVSSKKRSASKAGFRSSSIELPTSATQAQVEETIQALNEDVDVDGILVQLPLPRGLDNRSILDRLDPQKDVDGLHAHNVGKLWLDQTGLFPATPRGVVELLQRSAIELSGMEAVIVGRSHLVGKPLAGLLVRENCTVTICHSRTRDLAEVTTRADLLVAAMGRLAAIGADYVKEGAVVVDVGIHRVTERESVERLFPGNRKRLASFEKKGQVLAGDVDFDRVFDKCSAITPVPGGVGPLTVAMLLRNTLEASVGRQGLTA